MNIKSALERILEAKLRQQHPEMLQITGVAEALIESLSTDKIETLAYDTIKGLLKYNTNENTEFNGS